jgi:hypothetical protein
MKARTWLCQSAPRGVGALEDGGRFANRPYAAQAPTSKRRRDGDATSFEKE